MLSIRYTLARLLWEFDLTADPRSVGWDNQRGFKIWRKGPLFVKFTLAMETVGRGNIDP